MKPATWILLGCLAAAPALADDLCSAATSSVDVGDVTVAEDNTLDGKGTWAAGGGADGVLLEYRIDSDRMLSETRTGAAGSWDFERMLPNDTSCGRHTLVVFAFPSVKAGDRHLHCLKRVTSTPRVFEISCSPRVEIVDCQWECSGGDSPLCNGVCTATARRGKLGYVPYWGVNGEDWEQGDASSEGPWSHPVACAPGERISFKVRDRDGRGYWSEVDEIGCGVTE